MPNWIRLSAPASGALNANTLTRVGGAVVALMLAVLLISQQFFSSAPTEPEALTVADEPAGPRAAAALGQRVADIEQRAALERDAAERSLGQQRDNLSAGQVTPAFDSTTGAPLDPVTGAPLAGAVGMTQAELELREALRLEAIERRQRSIRSEPVAQTYRTPASAVADGRSDASSRIPAPPPEPPTLMESLAALSATADDLEARAGAAELGTAHEPAGAATVATLGALAPRADLSPLGPPDGATVPRGDPLMPAILRSPDTPPGWERIYEGSFLEAVLVNQLNGDFPGPVVAAVSVPFYSADRQRIVIPRGSRVVGSASAVGGRDQERLAVGFHRLIFPDGRWVTLEFAGLNQIGEGALKDQVNRHYLSMFASVGAIGVISGLTLRGSNPYAGGAEGFRAGAGQGLAQGATSILDRFLNRLPTITIRAGQRLRIWLTSDVLVPRPTIGRRTPPIP